MKDIQVIEDFGGWNEWYKNNEVGITDEYRHLQLHENQGVVVKSDDGAKDHGIVKGDKIVRIKNFYKPAGISAKNSEQTIALELLRDKSIPLKILSGVAGSGKTLLACAHALESLKGKTSKIIIAKSMTPVGREVGFLKGSLEDKVMPWMGSFGDNMVHCGIPPYELEAMIGNGTIEMIPITFIQGRSISNAIILIDEVQNLDMQILKQIITRAGEGSEIILLGDSSQVFERYLKGDSILTLIEKGRSSPLVGTIHLIKSMRSPIADWAVLNL